MEGLSSRSSASGAPAGAAPGRRSSPAAIAAALVLLLLGAALPGGVHLALPLAALAVPLAVLVNRPRAAAWRWAAAGSLLWVAEEAVWGVVRAFALPETILTDVLAYTGVALWLVALARMPDKRPPLVTALAGLPLLGFLGWLLLQDAPRALELQFPLIDALLLLACLPAVEGSLFGRAPDGRLLWVLGFFVRALAGVTFSWLEPFGAANTFLLLWLLAHVFIALGVWLELRDESGGLWATACAVLGLEGVIGAVTLLLLRQAGVELPGAPLAGAVFGYLLFICILMVLAADRRRRLRAERELRDWATLLERLMHFRPASDDVAGAIRELRHTVADHLPNLQGIELHPEDPAGEAVREGIPRGYPYPVVADGAEIGRFYFRRQPERTDLLDAVAPLLCNRLQQLAAHDQWRSQALTDPLTGLLNRRGLEQRLADLLARDRDAPVTVAMLDLDRFKRVNDVYGHPAGDAALQALATILTRHLRAHDLAVRWGGEEFLIVLHDTDLDGATEVVRRVRAELRASDIGPLQWPLTTSAGIAGGTAPGDGRMLRRWIEQADAALIDAKQRGRDRIECAPRTPPSSP